MITDENALERWKCSRNDWDCDPSPPALPCLATQRWKRTSASDQSCKTAKSSTINIGEMIKPSRTNVRKMNRSSNWKGDGRDGKSIHHCNPYQLNNSKNNWNETILERRNLCTIVNQSYGGGDLSFWDIILSHFWWFVKENIRTLQIYKEGGRRAWRDIVKKRLHELTTLVTLTLHTFQNNIVPTNIHQKYF